MESIVISYMDALITSNREASAKLTTDQAVMTTVIHSDSSAIMFQTQIFGAKQMRNVSVLVLSACTTAADESLVVADCLLSNHLAPN